MPNYLKLSVVGVIFLCFPVSAFSGQQADEFNKNFKQAESFQNINSDSVLFYATQSLRIAREMQAPNLEIDALKLIVSAEVKRGNYSGAINYCLLSDSILALNGLSNREIEILMYKGLVYQNSGLSLEGLEFYFKARGLIEGTGNFNYLPELDYYIAIAYYNINEYDLCRNYAKKSMNEEIARKDSSNVIENLILLSNTFQNTDSISKYLSLADKMSSGKKDYTRVVVLNNQALFNKALGNMGIAKKAYIEAIDIAAKNGFEYYLSTLYNNFAYLLLAENKTDSAGILLSQALQIAKELNNIDLQSNALDSYNDYYSIIGDTSLAYLYYKQSVQLKDEYKAKQQVARAMFLSTVFETDKKEQEIAGQKIKINRITITLLALLALFSLAIAGLLYFRHKTREGRSKLKIIEQEKKIETVNALIEGQDTERKRLAMDLHDGVSPNIAVLKLLVSSNYEKSGAYAELIHIIEGIGNNIREISHKMLPSQLESKGLVVALDNYIISLNKSNTIDISFYTDLEKRLPAKYELNLFLLFSEMINNALKHSGATEITVQLLNGEGSLHVSVEDNGKGFDTSAEYEGIGLRNIRQRVSYLNGEIDFHSVIGEGTAILIEFNKQQL